MNKPVNPMPEFSAKEQKVLRSVHPTRIVIPVLIGIGVVLLLIYRALQREQMPEVDWTGHTLFWLLLAVVLLGVRHLAYTVRLWMLTNEHFSFRKCIELIFIWEFSSAITPTAVGGAAVTAFVFSQEKLPGGKIVTILVYTIVLDVIFFVGGLPLLIWIVGEGVLSPSGTGATQFAVWRNTFYTAYVAMVSYGSVFFYGIFIGPNRVRGFLLWLTSFKWTKRFRKRAEKLGGDLVITSLEIRKKTIWFHLGTMLATFMSWSIRFVLVMCMIVAFVPYVKESADMAQQTLLYGRLQVMYIVLALSPTPGGVGIAEAAFGPFLSDFILDKNGNYMESMAIIIAFLWRLLTYYFYLLAGAIILPNWIRNVINQRRQSAS